MALAEKFVQVPTQARRRVGKMVVVAERRKSSMSQSSRPRWPLGLLGATLLLLLGLVYLYLRDPALLDLLARAGG